MIHASLSRNKTHLKRTIFIAEGTLSLSQGELLRFVIVTLKIFTAN